jgi:predicted DNA binding CopG/RHH family protein
MKNKLVIPDFKNDAEEQLFWDTVDISDYYDASDFEKVSYPNLKTSSRPISIRLPEYLLNRVKEKANEIHVPYQALIKEYIKKGVLAP